MEWKNKDTKENIEKQKPHSNVPLQDMEEGNQELTSGNMMPCLEDEKTKDNNERLSFSEKLKHCDMHTADTLSPEHEKLLQQSIPRKETEQKMQQTGAFVDDSYVTLPANGRPQIQVTPWNDTYVYESSTDSGVSGCNHENSPHDESKMKHFFQTRAEVYETNHDLITSERESVI